MSQQDASKTRPYRGLVLDTRALLSLIQTRLYQAHLHSAWRCLSSTKTMRQHIVLVTESSFYAVRHPTDPSSSVLICGQQQSCPVDYRVWGMLQERVYRVPIRNTDELRKRLVATWAEFQHSVVDYATDQWRKRLEACIRAEGGHFEHLL